MAVIKEIKRDIKRFDKECYFFIQSMEECLSTNFSTESLESLPTYLNSDWSTLYETLLTYCYELWNENNYNGYLDLMIEEDPDEEPKFEVYVSKELVQIFTRDEKDALRILRELTKLLCADYLINKVNLIYNNECELYTIVVRP